MKLLRCLPLLLCLLCTALYAQNVNINASGGTAFATYPTLGAAFTAVNSGTHTGNILVTVVNSTNEGATPATLNASGSGAASYTRVYVTTTSLSATVAGAPPSGSAVVMLNGADNVTLNGAMNGMGTSRNLSIVNNTAAGTNLTAAVWLASAGTALGCVNDTIMNLNIRGNDPGSATVATWGIFAAGNTLSLTGQGADNDNLVILNNLVTRAWNGMFVRGTTGGTLGNLVISRNEIGSATPADYIGFAGIDVRQAPAGTVADNYIHDLRLSPAANIFGIEIGAGCTGLQVVRNRVGGLANGNSGNFGVWGINLNGSSGVTVANNMLWDLTGYASNANSLTFNTFGIRLNGSASNHILVYNSVHLYGNVTGGTGPSLSACLCVNVSSLAGCVIRNNVFQNKMNGPGSGNLYAAVASQAATSWGGMTVDNNAYLVPATATASTAWSVGLTIGTPRTDLTAWRGVTGQDAASFPLVNGNLAPFVADNDLHINAATPTFLESGGAVLTVTTDFDAQTRQGSGGYAQVPAGSAPDIGADEFAQAPSDWTAPTLGSVTANPPLNSCTAVNHTVSATITDASGVASAVLKWFLNGVAQPDLSMSLNAGTWQATLPASGSSFVSYYVLATDASPNGNQIYNALTTYQDQYLTAVMTASADSICVGQSVNLTGSTTFGAQVKITEITQLNTGTGATSPYPAWVTGNDFVEITNLGTAPVDMSGWLLKVRGSANITWAFPAGTLLPAAAVMVVHLGTGTDNAAQQFYNTQTTSDALASNAAAGYVLALPNGRPMDVVCTNSYNFGGAEGVTTADWSGVTGSTSGRAGILRTASDTQTAADWVVSNTPSPLQTIGSLNPGLSLSALPTSVFNPGNISGYTATVSPTLTTEYFFTISDAACSVSDSMTVVVQSVPAAPGITPDTICGYDTLHLLAAGAPVLQWFDAPSGGSLLTTGGSLDVLTQTGITVYVSSWNGTCSGPRVAVTGVVNPAPAVSLSVADSICAGNTVTLSASSAHPAYSYTWSGAFPTISGSTVNVVPATSGWVYLEAWDGSCRLLDSLQQYVQPATPVTAGSSADTVCIGQNITLTGGFTPVYTQDRSFFNAGSFSVPDGNSSGIQISVLVNGVQENPMTATTLVSACVDINSLNISDLRAMLISPGGDTVELFTQIGGTGDHMTSACFVPGGTAPLVSSGTSPFSGSWTPMDPLVFSELIGTDPNGTWKFWISDLTAGNAATVDNVELHFNDYNPFADFWTASSGFTANGSTVNDMPATSTDYYFHHQDLVTGCEYVDTVSVFVHPPLGVTASGPAVVCTGAQVTLTATAAGGNGDYMYHWDGNMGVDTLAVTVNSDTSFVIELYDMCGTPAALDTVLITVYDSLSVTVNSDTTICEGQSVWLMSWLSALGDGAPVYSWSTGSSGAAILVNPVVTTVYTLTVTDGCPSHLATASATVTVDPLPVAGFSSTDLGGGSFSFTSAAANASTWSWDFGDGNTSTQQNPTHTYALNGNYPVTLIVTNGCGADTLTDTVSFPIRILAGMGDAQALLYPNPNTGAFFLALQGLAGQEIRVDAVNLLGQPVCPVRVMQVQAAQELVSFDLPGLAGGYYLLRLRTGGAEQRLPFTVH